MIFVQLLILYFKLLSAKNKALLSGLGEQSFTVDTQQRSSAVSKSYTYQTAKIFSYVYI